jgi:hypothetical protein
MVKNDTDAKSLRNNNGGSSLLWRWKLPHILPHIFVTNLVPALDTKQVKSWCDGRCSLKLTFAGRFVLRWHVASLTRLVISINPQPTRALRRRRRTSIDGTAPNVETSRLCARTYRRAISKS